MNIMSFDENIDGNDYVVGDIHGCYDLLMEKLESINFNKECDRLFCVGDLIDRGPKSYDCLNLVSEPWFWSVLGNHEIMMLDALRGANEDLWVYNGGAWFVEYDFETLKKTANTLIEKMPLAIDIMVRGKKVGIIHADVSSGVWGEFNGERDLWSRKRINSSKNYGDVEGVEYVFVGHTILKESYIKNNVIYIDTGAFVTGNLQLLNIREIIEELS